MIKIPIFIFIARYARMPEFDFVFFVPLYGSDFEQYENIYRRFVYRICLLLVYYLILLSHDFRNSALIYAPRYTLLWLTFIYCRQAICYSKSQGDLKSLVKNDGDDEPYQEKIIIHFRIENIDFAKYANKLLIF